MVINILLLGSGGREHALAWKIAQSPLLGQMFIAPGNAGTSQLGTNVTLDHSDFEAVLGFINDHNIDLAVVGPEQPLVDGIVDFLQDHNIRVFGPSKTAAMLEGSKAYAKNIMKKNGVPTADYAVFAADDSNAIKQYLNAQPEVPIVLKADGLAAGKGVLICENPQQAWKKYEHIRETGAFGEAASTIVFEEFMQGEEASVFAICDGENYKIIGVAQDHKRIGEGDTGPNTGGMGAYAPAPLISSDLLSEIEERVIQPMLKGMQKEQAPYQGVLYCGMMITREGAKVVEFNCRFGDPECQVILPLLETDLIQLMLDTVSGSLDRTEVHMSENVACTVVMAAEGYPKSYKKGLEITGLDETSALVFHAGTRFENGKVLSSGGRVLNVVGLGKTLQDAIDQAYLGVESLKFEGAYFRRDIGQKGLNRIQNS